ncbi:synaptic vesicle glycoprotein 2C-like isoform X2 [Leptopilina heterotoma]|uniref:synaptic vesicle glycoprotein 2C-like isoform X2 n=1 Tax=Leptopilina heterotoma TaxID=63436 RepID=UPI001CA91D7C|nr:synaptic vesicle glycoprotein 2C-like isoform X2 [Leptopilina heterotoma]
MSNSRIEESVVDMAVDETGFGKFSIKITIICLLIYLNASLSIVSTGYMLPASSCDFKMTLFDKGLLLTSFLIGSCFSPVICGFLFNYKGRKWTLLLTLFFQGTADFLIPIFPNYWILMILKFFSGFGGAGQLFIFTYMGECLPSKQRDILMSLMELFWIIGDALACSLGMGILPLNIDIRINSYFFRSWSLYILICSTLAISLGCWLLFLPETPKYLAEIGSREECLFVLKDMYKQNTGKSGKEYLEKLMNSGKIPLMELVNNSYKSFPEKIEKPLIGEQIILQLREIKKILKPPFLKNTFLACLIGFSINFSYDAFYIWFPEIFQRFSEFQSKNTSANLKFCSISNDFINAGEQLENDTFECNSPIDTQVFMTNLLLCASCAPAVFPLLLLVNRFGFRTLLIIHCSLCSVLILALYFVNSSLHILIILCIYVPLISTSVTMSNALFVHIFPTTHRSSGVALTSMACRIGAIFGNMAFTYLIDSRCFIYIILITLQLVVGAISTLLIRERKDT